MKDEKLVAGLATHYSVAIHGLVGTLNLSVGVDESDNCLQTTRRGSQLAIDRVDFVDEVEDIVHWENKGSGVRDYIGSREVCLCGFVYAGGYNKTPLGAKQ